MSIKATVVWPGKDWDNKPEYGGGKRTSATFEVVGKNETKEVKVNSSNPDSPKAMYLKSLTKGQTVYLTFNKARGDIPEFWDVDAYAMLVQAPSGGGQEPEDNISKLEALDRAKAKLAFFYKEALKMCDEHELPLDMVQINAAGFTLMQLVKEESRGY